eukprot:scaffold43469_cov34-Tisochrysis_lutea.AAC.1
MWEAQSQHRGKRTQSEGMNLGNNAQAKAQSAASILQERNRRSRRSKGDLASTCSTRDPREHGAVR